MKKFNYFFAVKLVKIGSITIAEKKVIVKEINSKSPIEEVPLCSDNANDENEHIVVAALINIALGVLLSKTFIIFFNS